jgi:hypothetical protein
VGVVLFGVLEDVADEIEVILKFGWFTRSGVWIMVMGGDVEADAGVVADVGQSVVEGIEIGPVVFGKVQAFCEILVQLGHGLRFGQVKDNFVNIHIEKPRFIQKLVLVILRGCTYIVHSSRKLVYIFLFEIANQ